MCCDGNKTACTCRHSPPCDVQEEEPAEDEEEQKALGLNADERRRESWRILCNYVSIKLSPETIPELLNQW